LSLALCLAAPWVASRDRRLEITARISISAGGMAKSRRWPSGILSIRQCFSRVAGAPQD
jgi:hypothetical protein